ncbi:hypothetical protein SAMN05216419_10655 [Nitrosomonas cryotolerans]|nr:hypothetical protein SAMN05216419_10655 [Nitrosomonas cryotolerans]
MSNQNTPDMLLRVCCAITSTDPELVMQRKNLFKVSEL